MTKEERIDKILAAVNDLMAEVNQSGDDLTSEATSMYNGLCGLLEAILH